MRTRLAVLLLLVAFPLLASSRPAEEGALPERYRKWLEEEVVYIITDYERQAFLKLPDDAIRDAFIKAFWEARDPTPGTARNEYQVDHYRRISEATRLFGQGKKRPGWKTERGRVYIQLGPPQDRTSYPMEARLYPIEDWFYQGNLALGLPTFFHVLFYRPDGAGDYELYNPMSDGPEKLVGGSPGAYVDRFEALKLISDVSSELGVTSLSLIPSDPIDIATGRASPSSGRLVEKLGDFGNNRPVETAYVERVVGGKGKVEVDYSFRSLGIRGYFHGAFERDGGTVLHYAVEVPPTSLTLERYGDRVSGALQVVGRLFTEDGTRPVLELDEKVEIDLSISEFEKVKSSPFAFEDVVPLLPGRYQANLMVRNLVSREFGTVEGKFEVPQPPRDGGLALGALLVAARSAPAADEPGKPFVFGERIWHPAPDRTVVQKGELQAVFQVLYPAAAHVLGDELKVRYVIRAGADERVAGFGKVALNPVFDRGLAVGTVRSSLAALPSGEYTLEVAVSGRPKEQAARSAPFRIRFDVPDALPWVYSRKRLRESGETQLLLASQAAARGEEELGLRLLEQLAADPAGGSWATEARQRIAEQRIRRKEYAAAAAAVEPLAAVKTGNVQSLVLLALARSGQGRHADAIAAFEQALAESPRSPKIWNALGEEQLKSGARERAAESWRRSLELEPEQPELRERLAGLERPAAGAEAPPARP